MANPNTIMDAQTQALVQLDGTLVTNAGGNPSRAILDVSPDTSAIAPSDLDNTDDDLLDDLGQAYRNADHHLGQGVSSRTSLMQRLTQAETQVEMQRAELLTATDVVGRLQTAGQTVTSDHARTLAVLEDRDALIQEQRNTFAAEHARQEAEIQRTSSELVQVQQAASTLVLAHGQDWNQASQAVMMQEARANEVWHAEQASMQFEQQQLAHVRHEADAMQRSLSQDRNRLVEEAQVALQAEQAKSLQL